MSLSARKSAILAKIETLYGTDSIPTGAANAMLVENLNVTPLRQEMVERKIIQGYFGGRQSFEAGAVVEVSFDVEVAGSGAAGTAPAYGPLLRMCGLSETIVPATSVAYKPISASFEAGTIYFYADGVLHKALGARGSVSLKTTAKNLPAFSFKFTGLYAPVSDVAMPTLALTAFQAPVPVNNANTSGFSLAGYAGVLSDFSMDMANTVVHRVLIGNDSIMVTDRNVTGKVVIEAVTTATKDFYSNVKASTLNAFNLLHGTVAGNKVQIASSTVQLLNPSYSDMDGIRMLNLDMKFIPSTAGNDEFTITLS